MISQYGNTYYGLDADKSGVVGVAVNGRVFVAMDTGKRYFFDGENAEWKEKSGSGGGGGGGDFDAIVDISRGGGSYDPTVFTVVKGSYAALYQMLESGHMPRMLVTNYDPVAFITACSACISAYAWRSDHIRFYVRFIGGDDVTEILDWESDDTLHWV